MKLSATIAVALCAMGLAGAALASSLRVAPVLLDVRAPTATASVRIWNESDRPINVQLRLFRWVQVDGEERLEPTRDVVVSPPLTTLNPGSENIVRIVRPAKAAARAEESYRLLVDELPDPARRRDGTVTMVLRHSIPVFFGPAISDDADVGWTVARRPGGFLVTARNAGGSRLRIADLALRDGGTTVARQDGLVGYALARSSASWFVSGNAPMAGGSLAVSVTSEGGTVNAVAPLDGG